MFSKIILICRDDFVRKRLAKALNSDQEIVENWREKAIHNELYAGSLTDFIVRVE